MLFMLENLCHQITKDGDSENEHVTLSFDKGVFSSPVKPQHATPAYGAGSRPGSVLTVPQFFSPSPG